MGKEQNGYLFTQKIIPCGINDREITNLNLIKKQNYNKLNEKIIKNTTKRKFIKAWDIATFRGGTKGILHRTPDSALKSPSLQMRLDHSSYLKNIEKFYFN